MTTDIILKEEQTMLKRILAVLSALLAIGSGAVGVQYMDRSRKNRWDLPNLGWGFLWLSGAVFQLLSACAWWAKANEEAEEDGLDDFDDFEIITD